MNGCGKEPGHHHEHAARPYLPSQLTKGCGKYPVLAPSVSEVYKCNTNVYKCNHMYIPGMKAVPFRLNHRFQSFSNCMPFAFKSFAALLLSRPVPASFTLYVPNISHHKQKQHTVKSCKISKTTESTATSTCTSRDTSRLGDTWSL